MQPLVRIRCFLLAASVLLLLGGMEAVRAEGKLKVVTSFLPVYCFTASVAGDFAEVENLLPVGVGPHDYQFAPRDVRKLAAADLFVVNGLGVEDWLTRAVKAVAGQGKPLSVVTVSAGLDKQLIHGPEEEKSGRHEHHHHHGDNPHIWLDPQLAAHAVTNVLTALQKADPQNAAGYAANAAKYLARLEALDREIKALLEPVKSRPFVTYHDAFPYFTRRYGLNLVGVVERVPDVEPTPRERVALMKTLRDKQVKVIFTEPQFSSKLAKQIAKDAGTSLAELDTIETGALAPQTYEELMRKNARTLSQQLK